MTGVLVAAALGLSALPAAAAAPFEQEVLEGQSQATANLQQALAAKGFYRGPIDGAFNSQTQHAIMAFRKEIGAARTYSWSTSLWDELNSYVKPWTPYRHNEPDRIEINLSRQLLYLFRGGSLHAIIPVSSGNGQPYANQFGRFINAHTPTGDFTIQRHIRGERISYLGTLWNPWYFVGGYAIHGSPSVPGYPASHGCVRVTFSDSNWLEGRLFIGMPVHVWWEPAGVGPVLEPGGQLPVGGNPPCPPGVTCDTVAFQDRTGMFHLLSTITHGPGISSFFYGRPGDAPFGGDWNGDGTGTLGLYRRSDGFAYLRNSNSVGVADVSFFFGNPGDIPLAGDFDGDGFDTVSIYRPSEQRVYIVNKLGQNGASLGPAEYSYLYGNPGDVPFVGDFDGDGVDTIGLHRPSTGQVYLNNQHDSLAEIQFVFGDPGDRLVAGDWNDDGRDTVAVFRRRNGVLYVKNSNATGMADAAFDIGFLENVVTISR